MWKLSINKPMEDMRVTFVKTLQELMNYNDKIIALEADLGGASGFTKIQKSHPNQFIQVGIAEANLIGVAAGLSMRNYIPFVHTFAPFSTRRALDQIFLEGAYAGNTINIYGSDPGICVCANGGTHNSFEDIAIMRAIPTVVVVAPADSVQLKWCIKCLAKLKGVHYIRANRKANPCVYGEASEFTLGKGNIIKEGKDVLLISMGEMLSFAYSAAKKLDNEGISTEVIDMFTLKPFDEELIIKEAKGKKLIVSFENHSVIGGLGSAIANIIAENNLNVRLKKIGINDQFGQVGDFEYLRHAFGLTEENIISNVKKII